MKKFSITQHGAQTFASDERHFFEGLTRWNYFPNQKANASELPPSISTRQFTPEVAILLAGSDQPRVRRRLGFDLVEYRSTRYNNVPRVLGLIHPAAYAALAVELHANFEKLEAIKTNLFSAIRPDRHHDGRILIMNYENQETKMAQTAKESFGKKYRAHTDISNCFGSIYTHSLEWATRGFEETKRNMAAKPADQILHWTDSLDKVLRSTKRNETFGLAIGPASSSIAVEFILGAIDLKLSAQGFKYTRYIDDYSALTDSKEDAQKFIRALSRELGAYKLTLNLSKTLICELPEPLQASWVSELMSSMPSQQKDDGGVSYLSTAEALRFLDLAVRLNNATPDGSVIKYAVSAISHRVNGSCANIVFDYVLNLCWHFPILLPFLEKIDIDETQFEVEEISKKLNSIAITNSLHRRSDGIAWALYYLRGISSQPSPEAISAIFQSGDCVGLAMLSKFETGLPRVMEFVEALPPGEYSKDEYWLVLYELFNCGRILNPYDDNDRTFELLKSCGVSFIPPSDQKSAPEHYCDYLSNPFREEHQVATPFTDWMAGRWIT